MEIKYYGDKITHHIAKTPEGFLICQDVPISRTGYQTYLSSEMFDNPENGHRAIPVYRPADEVFDIKSLASFEGKPVTNEHPDEDVTPENYSRYSCGHVQNVHVGTGKDSNKVLADLYITDPHLIHLIQHGKREISCGYYAEERRDASGRICQTRIRGNHVAVVKNGRAGKNVCIRDKKPDVISRHRTNEDSMIRDFGVKGMKKGVRRWLQKAKEGAGNAVHATQNAANAVKEKANAVKENANLTAIARKARQKAVERGTAAGAAIGAAAGRLASKKKKSSLFGDNKLYKQLGDSMRRRRYLYDEEPFVDDDVLLDEDILEDDDYIGDDDFSVDDCMDNDFEDEDVIKDDDYLADDDYIGDDDYSDEDIEDDDFEDEDVIEDDDLCEDDDFEDDDFEDDDLCEDDDYLADDDFEDEDVVEDDDEEFGSQVNEVLADARRTLRDARRSLRSITRDSKRTLRDAIILNDDDLEDEDVCDDDLIQTDADLCDDDYLADDELCDEDFEDDDILEDEDEMLADDDEMLSDDDFEDDDILSDDDEVLDDDEMLSDGDEMACDDDVEVTEQPGNDVIDSDSTRALREITEASRGISDPNERKSLQDAIYKALCKKTQMPGLMKATQKNMKNRMDSASNSGKKLSVENQQSIYDSFNPHKKTQF